MPVDATVNEGRPIQRNCLCSSHKSRSPLGTVLVPGQVDVGFKKTDSRWALVGPFLVGKAKTYLMKPPVCDKVGMVGGESHASELKKVAGQSMLGWFDQARSCHATHTIYAVYALCCAVHIGSALAGYCNGSLTGNVFVEQIFLIFTGGILVRKSRLWADAKWGSEAIEFRQKGMLTSYFAAMGAKDGILLVITTCRSGDQGNW